MCAKYTSLFDDMIKYMKWQDDLSDEENKSNGCKYFKAVDELCQSKDMAVLERLLDFFNEENEEYGGVCEDLKSQIGANFTLRQLLQALYKKFDYLATHDVSKLVQFSFWFFANEMFGEFQEMFNTVRSSESAKFLDELDDWSDDDYSKERNILREDMKKWQS